MKDTLIEQFMCLVEKIAATSKCSYHFETDTDIYRREIHAIKLIGDHSSLHVSEIARKFGVTKGAVSQILKKLEKKGLIQKFRDEENNTRMLVRLTEKGQTAYDAHEKYHRQYDSEIYDFLDKISPSELKIINEFVEMIDKMWDKHL
ncbi:MAG: MarR family transcriptional regulator [Spirochaetales bacterium]|nr:MarR family transcriptional regulator [Spirochaetales bacterium]